MKRNRYLLDTSALLTLIEDEAGADYVAQILRNAECYFPWLALLETHYITQQERDKVEADRRYAFIHRLPGTIVWQVSEAIVLTSARLKANYHISLADSIVAAIAIDYDLTLLHKDPEFESLNHLLQLKALPYKA